MNYGCSAAIGAVSGLRAFTGPAIISDAASRKIVPVKRTPVSWRRPTTSRRPPPFSPPAALAAAWVGYQYRQRVKLPKFLAVILEDTVAVTAGTAVVKALCR